MDEIEEVTRHGIDKDYWNAWYDLQGLFKSSSIDEFNRLAGTIEYYEQYIYRTNDSLQARRIIEASSNDRKAAINTLVKEWNLIQTKTLNDCESFTVRAKALIYG